MKMRRKFWIKVLAVAVLSFAAGCYSVKPVDRVALSDQMTEGSVVFVRAEQFTMWFGSHSPRAYFEIVYERFSRNEAGFPVVELGLRYRGGVHWTDWNKPMPQTVTLGAVCNFYATPAAQAGGPILYSTNREQIVLRLGETYAYKAVCPVKKAGGYQIVLGE